MPSRKKIETSKKVRGATGYWKHLRRYGKQVANRATRRIGKKGCKP